MPRGVLRNGFWEVVGGMGESKKESHDYPKDYIYPLILEKCMQVCNWEAQEVATSREANILGPRCIVECSEHPHCWTP